MFNFLNLEKSNNSMKKVETDLISKNILNEKIEVMVKEILI
jgi:hypothetical protein